MQRKFLTNVILAVFLFAVLPWQLQHNQQNRCVLNY
jgi:hypothetical protein